MDALERAMLLCRVRGVRVVVIDGTNNRHAIREWCESRDENVRIIDGDATIDIVNDDKDDLFVTLRLVYDPDGLARAVADSKGNDVIVIDEVPA